MFARDNVFCCRSHYDHLCQSYRQNLHFSLRDISMATFARTFLSLVFILLALAPTTAIAQPKKKFEPSRANVLRGEYSRFRANSDLTYYHLDIRVDPEKKTIRGKNTIR